MLRPHPHHTAICERKEGLGVWASVLVRCYCWRWQIGVLVWVMRGWYTIYANSLVLLHHNPALSIPHWCWLHHRPRDPVLPPKILVALTVTALLVLAVGSTARCAWKCVNISGGGVWGERALRSSQTSQSLTRQRRLPGMMGTTAWLGGGVRKYLNSTDSTNLLW